MAANEIKTIILAAREKYNEFSDSSQCNWEKCANCPLASLTFEQRCICMILSHLKEA